MDVLDKLNRLIQMMSDLPQNMDRLANYGQNILIAVVIGVMLYALRSVIGGTIGGIVGILRFRAMLKVEDRESVAKEVEAVVKIAEAEKGGGAVSEDDLIEAVQVYANLAAAIKKVRPSKPKK